MIKRINKIVALVLIATTVATITPIKVLNKSANAAETVENGQTNISVKNLNTLTENQILDILNAKLREKYPEATKVEIDSTPVKTISIPLTKIAATAIVTPMVTDEMVSSMVTDEIVDAQTLQVVKAKMQSAAPNGTTITDEQAKAYMDSMNKIELNVIKDGVRTAMKVKVKQKIIETLATQLEEASKSVPLYKYRAIDEDNSKIVSEGFIVGGKMSMLLIQGGKGIVALNGDKLDNTIIGDIISTTRDKIFNAKISVTEIVSEFTDSLDDIADLTDDLSDSIRDKGHDVDKAWDKVFDRFDNDQGWTKKDGYTYYYDEDGVSLKGVQKIDGKTYYFNKIDGAMETGWQVVDGNRAYFDKDKGYQLTKQWVKDSDDWYFIDENGIVKKSSWIQDNGNYYYVKADGKMTTGWLKVDDYWYFFNDDGKMESSTWKWSTDSWYYLKSNGAAATGWLQLGGNWYCFKELSAAMQTGWFRYDGKWYCSGNDGAMKKAWVWTEDGYCYLDDSTGQMKKNEWVTVDGNSYYFNINGIMVTGSRYIDGTKYTFDSEGRVSN